MDLYHELKSQGLPKAEAMEKIQRWYLGDKEKSIQTEFENLLDEWDTAPQAQTMHKGLF